MRSFSAAVLAAGLALSAAAAADPKPGSGYRLETVSEPGAVFSGLSRDGDLLLLTNLADGRLYRRSPDGKLVAFGPALSHGLDAIGDPTGPYQAVRYGENYLVAEGWTPIDADEGPNDHALIEVDENGVVKVIHRDFWNPFDFAVSGDAIYVVDAARNSLERLTDRGAKTTLFTFPRLSVSGAAMQTLSPTQFSNDAGYEVDAVPTGVALSGGRIYVSLFGGLPFIAGEGKVISIEGSEVAPLARLELDGLNAPVDIAFDTDGRLLVLEHGVYRQGSGFQLESGRLLGVDLVKGERQVMLNGLTRPASIAVWDDDALIVSDLGGNLFFLTREAAD